MNVNLLGEFLETQHGKFIIVLLNHLSKIPQKPVIIVSVDIRRYFRKMIEKDYYELPVLSFQELSQEINIQPLGRLKL